MKDNFTFHGHFKIESIDKNNVVQSAYEDENMIVVGASLTMSQIFANLNTNTFINELRLGTMGHVGTDILHPKLPVDGLVKTRDRMFCESSSSSTSPVVAGGVIATLNNNDLHYIQGTGITSGYYRYLQPAATNYTILVADVNNATVWSPEGTTVPYKYFVNFTVPGTNLDKTNGDFASNITETDAGAGSTVRVLQTGTSVVFTVDIPVGAANSQFLDYSIYTEAALMANGRAFSLKTFKAKVKDTTVTMRVTWTITF